MKRVIFIIMLCCLLFNLTPVLAAANIDGEHSNAAFATTNTQEQQAVTAFRTYPYRSDFFDRHNALADLRVLYQQIKKCAMRI